MVSPGKVAFTVFGVEIMWYGILISLAMLLACFIVYNRAPRYKINQDDLMTAFIVCIPIGIIGARAYYIAFNWDAYAGDWMKMLNFRGGGLAIHGGLLFGLGAAAIFCSAKRISGKDLLDLVAPAIVLAQAIGRWGNFFNEEAHGATTNFPIHVLIDGQAYHAAFLYESIWCLFLFFLLSLLSHKRKFPGQIFLLYAILYSAERFFVEALRTDSLMIGMFKQAQIFSLAVFIIGIICYVIFARREKNKTYYYYN